MEPVRTAQLPPGLPPCTSARQQAKCIPQPWCGASLLWDLLSSEQGSALGSWH